ncbi:hypothetical protein, partial [Nitrosovibrio tenuis]|uniref:hypothetical protein n=1 Tax=Nitrosovibrio tenuis TaxID=1233 RepID=UPI001C430975
LPAQLVAAARSAHHPENHTRGPQGPRSLLSFMLYRYSSYGLLSAIHAYVILDSAKVIPLRCCAEER